MKLHHSIYNNDTETLTGIHQAGFYSCINQVRLSLYELLNNKIYPKNLSFKGTLHWYRNSEDLFPILYKIDKDKFESIKEINFNISGWCPTGSKFDVIYFEQNKIIEDTYFNPSEIILLKVKELEEKYQIDYQNTIAVFHRGNDKYLEATLASQDDWVAHINSKKDNLKVLIQTGDNDFKNKFLDVYKGSIFFEELTSGGGGCVLHPNSDFRINWSIHYESIMRIISKCKKIITHSGNGGIIPILYRNNLNEVSQCFNTGSFISY